MQKFGEQSWMNDNSIQKSSSKTNSKGEKLSTRCPYEYRYTIVIQDNSGNRFEFDIYERVCSGGGGSGGSDYDFGGGDGDMGEGDDPCNDEEGNTTFNCLPDPGGGGGSGDGGGGIGAPEPLGDDYVANIDTTDIDCSSSGLESSEKAWCASTIPKGNRLARTNNALNNIENRGQECIEIAQKGKQLLNEFGLRYYPSGTIKDGGRGGPSFGVLLSDRWISDYVNNVAEVIDNDGSKVRVNLEFALAHEIEHALGYYHIMLPNGKESRLQTPNAVKCSGL